MSTVTNTEWLTNLGADIAAMIAGTLDPAEFVANMQTPTDGWIGIAVGDPVLATKVSETVTNFIARDNNFDVWINGTPTGGASASDGTGIGGPYYPLRNLAGGITWWPCPAGMVQSTAKGDPGGIAFLFSTTTTDADPGSGKVRFDNATFASITKVFFDNNEAGGSSITAWLDTFDDGDASTTTPKGYLTFLEASSSKFAVFRVTGQVEDGTGYRKVSVTPLAGNPPFSNNGRVSVTFSKDGQTGWSPLIVSVADGARRVFQVTDWVGGQGTKPGIGYVGDTGLVATAAEAVDFFAAITAQLATLDDAVDNAQAAEAGAIAAALKLEEGEPEVFDIADGAGRVAARMHGNGLLELLSASIARIIIKDYLQIGATITLQEVAGFVETISDDLGRAVRSVDNAGVHRILEIIAKRLTVQGPIVAMDSISIGNASLGVSGNELEIADALGRAIARLGPDGLLTIVGILATNLTVKNTLTASKNIVLGNVRLESSDNELEVADVDGKAIASLGSDGNLKIVKVSAKSIDTVSANISKPIFKGTGDKQTFMLSSLAEIVHIAYYGQSWSMGFDATGILTTAQRHDTIMFNLNAVGEGIRQQYSIAEDATALQSFVPAVENLHTGSPEFPAATLGETGAVAMAHKIKDLIALENNIAFTEQSFQLLISAPGEGSKSLDQLADNGQPYIARLKEQIARAYTIAQAAGKTYVFAAITWIQGAGSSLATYAAQLEAMRADVDAYAKSVTGQAQDVRLLTWQQYPSTNTVGSQGSAAGVYSRFVGAADTYPNIICAGPSYQFSHISSGNIHFHAAGMQGLGEEIGQAFKRELVDGQNFEPLRPMSIRRQGSIALVRLNISSGQAVVDISQVVAKANYGFNLYDSGGSPLTISDVTLIGPDLVKITAAATISATDILRYADIGTDPADANKWRGNIRDNAADFDGVNRWLVAFSLPFDN